MNSFGRLFRVSILGESHGECVGVLIDGCPSGLPLSAEDLLPELERRQGGGAPGTTLRREADTPIFKSGLFNKKTTGAPLLLLFDNSNTDPAAYEKLKDLPRPSHADIVARQKFGGFNDPRGGGHFSGRLTAGLVAAGAIAKKILLPVSICAKITEAGGSSDLETAVERAMAEGDSVGGIVECSVSGLPPGLGEPFFDSAESLLSHAAFSIPAVKGVEFGDGFALARKRGSEANDEITDPSGRTATNRSGGINGGITNGNELLFRVAVRPTPSISKNQSTVNLATGERATISISGRHDACIALRVPPVLESAAAVVLLDLMMLEGRVPRVLAP